MFSGDGETTILELERIAQTEVGRNIAELANATHGDLLLAARALLAPPSPSVVVMTGAYVPWGEPAAAETDGPPGAAILASGLERLGLRARIVTDSLCLPVVAAAVRAVSPKMLIDRCDSEHELRTQLAPEYRRVGVTHVVAVERLGPASDGRVRNFRGEDVTAFTAPLHGLVSAGAWGAIGIGDGGNEVGMGNIPQDVVDAAIREGGNVHCVTKCDHLVVAGVSNWGAIALLNALALLRSPDMLALAPESIAALHWRLVEACVKAGAVDGTLGRRVPSVDGLDKRQHHRVISRISQLAAGEETI